MNLQGIGSRPDPESERKPKKTGTNFLPPKFRSRNCDGFSCAFCGAFFDWSEHTGSTGRMRFCYDCICIMDLISVQPPA